MEPELWEGNFWHWEIFAHWLASKDCILHMAALCFSLTATLLLIFMWWWVSPPYPGRQECVLFQLCISNQGPLRALSSFPRTFSVSYTECKASTVFWALGRSCTRRAETKAMRAAPGPGKQKQKPWGLLLALAGGCFPSSLSQLLSRLELVEGSQVQLVYCPEYTHTMVNVNMSKCPPQNRLRPIC